MRHNVVSGFVLALFWAGSANAGLIDFTGATGQETVWDTDSIASATLESIGGSLTWTNFDGDSGAPPCSTNVLACDNDGVGITNDEVSFDNQKLSVIFSSAVNVTAIHLFDLFGVGDDGTQNAEVAIIRFLNGGTMSLMTGTAVPGTLSGYSVLNQLFSGVTSIEFFSSSPWSPDNTDFALAAIEVSAVPEPGTLALLGIGLAAIRLARRRRI